MIIGNGPVITHDPDNPYLENGAIRIEGDTIVDVAPDVDLRAAHPGEDYVDVSGRVIMPGLINAHTHAYSHYARGMAATEQGTTFTGVLEKLWWKLDRLLEPEDVELNTSTTFVESIRNGVTTVIDHHSSPYAVTGSLTTQADAARALGIRASLCYETSDRDGPEILTRQIEENISFMKETAASPDDLITGLFGMHASFTVSQETLERCVTAVRDAGVTGFHVHTAEGPEDEPACEGLTGKRIVRRFHDAGMLGPETILVHCVHVDESEMELIKETDTSVVTNPHSNMGNAVGVTKVVEMLRRGIRCGLGTDAYLADMLASASVAKIAQSHRLADPTAGFMEAATLLFRNNPAIAARYWRKPLGVLVPGAYADVITQDYLPQTPMNGDNTLGHLLFGMTGALTHDTMVAGRWVMRDRRILTVDEAEIFARSRERAPRIWARM
ncbi:putative selenium metabolism protein SsnA [Austwickia chelonae]|uniref:Putative amidohydrolase n=1 Tax=Austwickia chelonae NBRC 105200 TaxID=1184607 RepID=K6ULT3_9MICO|nr:putative aminohydrolase SsnA [Austwickia chelonae]GAB77526.1 putative amidohydrolase [Austwickia chelonae NBRC 105200]SEW12178.1 putative selenium metabolism protein SsnA [Austwickia chelonae]